MIKGVVNWEELESLEDILSLVPLEFRPTNSMRMQELIAKPSVPKQLPWQLFAKSKSVKNRFDTSVPSMALGMEWAQGCTRRWVPGVEGSEPGGTSQPGITWNLAVL